MEGQQHFYWWKYHLAVRERLVVVSKLRSVQDYFP
jgi:hypothetical protein